MLRFVFGSEVLEVIEDETERLHTKNHEYWLILIVSR